MNCRRPYVLGLTGSIGMGKTTTAQMFRDEGIPVWDADAAVHRLYAPGGAAVAPLAALVPDALVNGGISRKALSEQVQQDPDLLKRIEAVVHPLVAKDRANFLARQSADIVVLDIPLLFETGAHEICDGVAVVTAPREVQKARVLARPGMTEGLLQKLLDRQMPDAGKQARADFLIDTSQGLEAARSQVKDILNEIRASHA